MAKIATRNKGGSEKGDGAPRFTLINTETNRQLYPGLNGWSEEEAERHDRDTVAPTRVVPLEQVDAAGYLIAE